MDSPPPPTTRTEPRWPAALAILALVVLVAAVPGHYRLLPSWAPLVGAVATWVPMAGVTFGADKRLWARIEGVVLKVQAAAMVAAAGAILAILVRHMVEGAADATGLQLLASSVVVWTCNVIAFLLLYWQIDGGGPAGRAAGDGGPADWAFPQSSLPAEAARGWRPAFVDYLFLGFSTATAFSTTDTLPLTARAKLLMMAEAALSMVTLVVVASRAINILGP